MNVSMYIITCITACPDGLATILVIMYVSTFKTVVITVYIYKLGRTVLDT